MKPKIAVLITVALLILVFFAGLFSNSNKIKNGVKIEGVSFSGYSIDKAEEKLNDVYDTKKNFVITLYYQGKAWTISSSDINVNYDTKTAVNNAYYSGRTSGFFGNFFDSIVFLVSGKNVQVPVSFDRRVLFQKLQVIAKEINSSAANASIIINPDGTLIKKPEKPGVKMDFGKTLKILEESITAMTDQSIQIAVLNDKAKITMKDIEDIDSEIGRAETVYNENQANRVSNIKNALKRIRGTIILPGEVFSLNKTLGPRNQDNGYKDAPVILNDELVPGMGGGICQVATTMYKASLQACLKVVERKHHSFPPVYVPVGQDATIAGDSIDLKIKNNLNTSIFINTMNKGNRIIISYYSKKPNYKRKVRIESQILEVVEPGPQQIIKDGSLEIGTITTEKPEKKGYKAAVFRNIYDGINLISREKISLDVYRPIRGVIRMGTGEKRATQEVIQNIFPSINDIQNEFIEEPDNPPEIN
ncbi:MAG: VanW family protein [Ignavibacteriales bacterium]